MRRIVVREAIALLFATVAPTKALDSPDQADISTPDLRGR
jgi:hypothetical protein